MIFALYCVYMERDALERAMDSVDRVFAEATHVVVDGRFTDFEAPTDFSTDGTRELAESRGIYLPVTDYECEKRTAGLRHIDTLATDGDWLIVLDADETITKIVSWPERVGYIEFTRKTAIEITYGRCRLYKWEPNLEFKYRHYELYDAAGELVANLEDAPDYQVVGFGNHYEKPRTKQKQAYYENLRRRESDPWKVPA